MRIEFEADCWERSLFWARNAGLDEAGKGSRTEVFWIGAVRLEADDVFVVEKVWLPRHETSATSGAHCETAEGEMARLHAVAIMEGFEPERLVAFCHSHADMSPFQSAEDRANARDRYWGKGICVAVTFNAKGETFGEVTFFHALNGNVTAARVSPVAVTRRSAVAAETIVEWGKELRTAVPPRVGMQTPIYVGGVLGGTRDWRTPSEAAREAAQTAANESSVMQTTIYDGWSSDTPEEALTLPAGMSTKWDEVVKGLPTKGKRVKRMVRRLVEAHGGGEIVVKFAGEVYELWPTGEMVKWGDAMYEELDMQVPEDVQTAREILAVALVAKQTTMVDDPTQDGADDAPGIIASQSRSGLD